MRILVIFGFGVLLLAQASRAEQLCSQTDLQASAQRAKAIRAQLLAVKVNGAWDGDLKPEYRQNIQQLKDELAVATDTSIHCSKVSITAQTFQEELQSLLNANKTQKKIREWQEDLNTVVDHVYGADLKVKVSRAENKANWMLVEFNFGIACGDDSMLLGYEWKQDKWTRVLRWQSDLDRIPNAFGDFFKYRVVQQQDSANWLVGVAHGSPWCSSNFSGFDLDIIQPAQNDAPQKVLLHKEEIYWRDDPTEMKLTPDGFELRVTANSRDVNIIRRTGIYRYRISGNQITRVQPIAMNGRDFVDEWLNSPWDESKNWNSSSDLAGLEAAHRKTKALKDAKAEGPPSFTYGPVRSCTDSQSHFQVELDEGWWVEQQEDWRPDKPAYFQIQEGKNSFTLLSASAQPDPHCSGADIMAKH